MPFTYDFILAGTRAAQPAAASTNNGYLYMVTDESNVLERSNGSSWVQVASGSGGWELAGAGNTATGVWDQAVDGSTANATFTGLGGYSAVLLIGTAITMSASGFRNFQVGHGAGPTWLTTSGDYYYLAGAGTKTDSTVMAGHSTGSASARYVECYIIGFNQARPKRAKTTHGSQGDSHIPTTNLLTAARLSASTGTLNGGVVNCYGLPA